MGGGGVPGPDKDGVCPAPEGILSDGGVARSVDTDGGGLLVEGDVFTVEVVFVILPLFVLRSAEVPEEDVPVTVLAPVDTCVPGDVGGTIGLVPVAVLGGG